MYIYTWLKIFCNSQTGWKNLNYFWNLGDNAQKQFLENNSSYVQKFLYNFTGNMTYSERYRKEGGSQRTCNAKSIRIFHKKLSYLNDNYTNVTIWGISLFIITDNIFQQ